MRFLALMMLSALLIGGPGALAAQVATDAEGDVELETQGKAVPWPRPDGLDLLALDVEEKEGAFHFTTRAAMEPDSSLRMELVWAETTFVVTYIANTSKRESTAFVTRIEPSPPDACLARTTDPTPDALGCYPGAEAPATGAVTAILPRVAFSPQHPPARGDVFHDIRLTTHAAGSVQDVSLWTVHDAMPDMDTKGGTYVVQTGEPAASTAPDAAPAASRDEPAAPAAESTFVEDPEGQPPERRDAPAPGAWGALLAALALGGRRRRGPRAGLG